MSGGVRLLKGGDLTLVVTLLMPPKVLYVNSLAFSIVLNYRITLNKHIQTDINRLLLSHK